MEAITAVAAIGSAIVAVAAMCVTVWQARVADKSRKATEDSADTARSALNRQTERDKLADNKDAHKSLLDIQRSSFEFGRALQIAARMFGPPQSVTTDQMREVLGEVLSAISAKQLATFQALPQLPEVVQQKLVDALEKHYTLVPDLGQFDGTSNEAVLAALYHGGREIMNDSIGMLTTELHLESIGQEPPVGERGKTK